MLKILGIKVDSLNRTEVLAKITAWLEGDKFNFLVTLNPEIVLAARSDEEYFYILNKADISVVDGFGLKLAARLLGEKVKRQTGVDLLPEILVMAETKNHSVLIANRRDGLSTKADLENYLSLKYPKLKFGVIDLAIDVSNLPENLPITNPEILIVNFGAPFQEKFIFHNGQNPASLKLAIGVGGGLDFLNGKAQRAPKFLRALGLEWFWRLIKYPRRAKRIYNAVIKFSLVFLKSFLIEPLTYRPNVACLLYRKFNDQYQILLVKRSEDADHWQLPQGGTDGEKLATAATREIHEELNTTNIIIRKIYKNVYKD